MPGLCDESRAAGKGRDGACGSRAHTSSSHPARARELRAPMRLPSTPRERCGSSVPLFFLPLSARRQWPKYVFSSTRRAHPPWWSGWAAPAQRTCRRWPASRAGRRGRAAAFAASRTPRTRRQSHRPAGRFRDPCLTRRARPQPSHCVRSMASGCAVSGDRGRASTDRFFWTSKPSD